MRCEKVRPTSETLVWHMSGISAQSGVCHQCSQGFITESLYGEKGCVWEIQSLSDMSGVLAQLVPLEFPSFLPAEPTWRSTLVLVLVSLLHPFCLSFSYLFLYGPSSSFTWGAAVCRQDPARM